MSELGSDELYGGVKFWSDKAKIVEKLLRTLPLLLKKVFSNLIDYRAVGRLQPHCSLISYTYILVTNMSETNDLMGSEFISKQ